MNKKFSTLMTTGLLLSGALFCNVNAAEKDTKIPFKTDLIGEGNVLTGLTEGDTLYFAAEQDLTDGENPKKYFIINTPHVTVLGKANENGGTSLNGRIMIVAEGVKVKHIDFSNESESGIGGHWQKTSLTAFVDTLSVDSCSFGATEEAKTLTNGIVLYPQTDKAAYNLKGNVFSYLDTTVVDKTEKVTWYSSAIQVYKKTKIETKEGDPLKGDLVTNLSAYNKGSGNPTIDAAAIVNANKFTDCSADMIVRNGNELDETGYGVEYAHISKSTGAPDAEEVVTKSGEEVVEYKGVDADLVAALVDVIKNSTKGTTIVVQGIDAQGLTRILTDTKTVPDDVAKEMANKNVAISTFLAVPGEVPEEPKIVPAGTIALGSVEVADDNVIRLVFTETGEKYVAPIAKSIADKKQYVLMTTDFKALSGKKDGTADTLDFPTTIPTGKSYKETYEPFLWTVAISKTEGYAKFTNVKTKKELVFDGTTTVAYVKLTNGAVTADNITFKKLADVVTKAGSDLKVGNVDMSTGKFAAADAPAVPDRMVTAEELNNTYGTSFKIAIEKDGKILKNDPFELGNLKPVVWANIQSGPELASPEKTATRFMLQDENGKLIIMKKSEMYATAAAGKYAYQVTTIDVETLAKAVKTGKDDDYAAYFSILIPYDNKVGIQETVSSITVEGEDVADGIYKLGSISLQDVNTLAACAKNDDFLDEVTIKLATFNTINVTALLNSGKYFTVTNKNTKSEYSGNFGKVLGLNNAGSATFMKPNEVLVGYPETQWAITADKDGKVLTLKNREYPTASKTYNAAELYKVGDNKYAIKQAYSVLEDTIEIVAVANPKATDGFKVFNAAKLKDQLFNLGSYSSVRDTVFVAENHKKDHQVGLVADKADATDWRMLPLMSQEEDVWGNPVKGTMTPATICIVSQINDGLGKTKADTLKVKAYAFQNIENGEYMAYDNVRNRYVTGADDQSTGYESNSAAHYFAVKIMGGDSTRFNLVSIDGYLDDARKEIQPNKDGGDKGLTYLNRADTCAYIGYTAPLNKIYAGESNEGILNRYGMYQQNETDLFTITEKAAPEYLTLNQGDVIKIYRAEYAASESNVLYEKSGFLGMGNAVETPKINPSIYVDPIDGSTDHPEYLLGLNARKVDATYECNEPSHSDLYHTTDTVYARYLVNLADSALAEDVKEDVHINKYIYNDGNMDYAKLAFVEGYCADDSLVYIKDQATGKYGEAMLITEAPQLFKFAFRVVDPETESFVVETGYKELNNESNDAEVVNGYLRYINGNVVVTSEIKKAEVFNLKEDSRDPVANESISTSAISVIAADGKVIVKGAAGKKVVISNVLGQTVANTVIASDEAAIAAPAGMVIVAVEGEEAVKAIVK